MKIANLISLLLLLAICFASTSTSAQIVAQVDEGTCVPRLIGPGNIFDYTVSSRNESIGTVSYSSPNVLLCGQTGGEVTIDLVTCLAGSSTACFPRTILLTVIPAPVNQEPYVANPISNVTGEEGDGNIVYDLRTIIVDPDGDPLVFYAAPSVSTTLGGNGYTLTISRANAVNETVTYRGTDPDGLYAESGFTVIVTEVGQENRAPVIVNPIANVTGVEGASPVVNHMGSVCSDEDGDVLTYSIVGTPASTTLSGSTMTTSRLAPVSETVTYRCTDPDLLYAQGSFTVNVTAAPPAPDSTFATQLNNTGDILGGGPGYGGVYRTAEGFSGPGIWSKTACQALGSNCIIVNTEAQLRAASMTYFNRATSATVSGSSPATSGQVVWIEGNSSTRILEIHDTVSFDFNTGVTVASDLGRSLGGGAYSWGTTVKMMTPILGGNPGFQTRPLFAMTRGYRLTGLILQGPDGFAGRSNVNDTRGWQGESLAIRVNNQTPSLLPEIDNVWAFGFSYMTYNLYQGPTSLHHFRSGWSWRFGYGYAVYPGRDASTTDALPTVQSIVGGWLHNSKHHTDLTGMSWNATTGQSSSMVDVRFQSLFLSGTSVKAAINGHSVNGPNGRGYGTWSQSRSRIAGVDYNNGHYFSANTNIPHPTGSYLWEWSWNTGHRSNWYYLNGNTFTSYLAGTHDLPPTSEYGTVTIRNETIFGDGEGIVRPIVSSTLNTNQITEGGSVTMTLNASDPDNHAIRYYEVVWGDGRTSLASITRHFPGDQPSHTYTAAGVYTGLVTAINEHGVTGIQPFTVYVAPADLSTPKWTFLIGSEPPPQLHYNASANNSIMGVYEARVIINGVQVFSYDWGDPAYRGWRSVTVDATASLAGATQFQLTLETATIGSPLVAYPDTSLYRADWYFDNLKLWGDDGLDADEAAWDKMDPLFDLSRTTGQRDLAQIETQWNFQAGGARLAEYDMASDWGFTTSYNHGTEENRRLTVGEVSSRSSTVRGYLNPVNVTAFYRGPGNNLVLEWGSGGNVRTGVRIRIYDDAALTTLLYTNNSINDSASPYTISGSSGWTSVYAVVEGSAPHWTGTGTVYSRPTVQAEGLGGATLDTFTISRWDFENATDLGSPAIGSVALTAAGTGSNRPSQAAGVGGGFGVLYESSVGFEAFSATSAIAAPTLGMGNNSFAVSMWLAPASFPNNPSYALTFGGISTSSNGYALDISNTGVPSFRVSDGSVRRSATWGGPLNTGVYQHILGIVDRTAGTISIRVNCGTPVTTALSTFGTVAPTSVFRLSYNSNTLDYDGLMDKVRIWNGVPDASQIAELCAEGP